MKTCLIFLFLLLSPSTQGQVAPALLADKVIVQNELKTMADSVDDLFGHDRADDNKSDSTLRLIGEERIEDQRAHEPSLGVRFNIKLSTLDRWNRQLQQWITKDLQRLEKRVIPEKHASTSISPQNKETSQLEEHKIENPWRFSIDKQVHLKRKAKVDTNIVARLRKDFETPHLLHSLAGEIGWSTHELWATELSTGSYYHLTKNWLLNFSNILNWPLSEKTFSTVHGPSIVYNWTAKQAALLETLIQTSVLHEAWLTHAYTINGIYRIETHDNFAYFSINPYITWPKKDHFKDSPGVTARIEIVF